MNGREQEIAEIGRQYGAPAIRHCVQEVSPAGLGWWVRASHKRYGEVVLFILRGNSNLLLHSKDFYPAGAVRVPSGTVKENEPLLEAVRREAYEETGLTLAIERFLAVVEFEFRFQQNVILFSSYLFLLRDMGGELRAVDASERISSFSETSVSGLLEVAESLENMPPERRDWGRFRAYPHRLAVELLVPGSGGLSRF
jgi:ADP-ribose pyrophosphatase YjhB (NUDIX family)